MSDGETLKQQIRDFISNLPEYTPHLEYSGRKVRIEDAEAKEAQNINNVCQRILEIINVVELEVCPLCGGTMKFEIASSRGFATFATKGPPDETSVCSGYVFCSGIDCPIRSFELKSAVLKSEYEFKIELARRWNEGIEKNKCFD